MLVDWAGIAASVFDPVTGRRSPAYLFVASFPWSSWVYAECFPDMRTRSWIAAHVHALQAAGGVPDILVPDNCATATDRRRRSGPVKVNDACLEMAEHYGRAAVPARVRRPRGKASAEKAVDLCETWVLAPLAEEGFASFDELNAEVRRPVDALDARPFSRRGGCRDDALLGEEGAALNPLPEAPFEWCEWRRRKVSPDHHVQCDHMRYSVPHRLVGRTVDVRLGASTVAVLDGGETVAEHPRLRGRRGQCSTPTRSRHRATSRAPTSCRSRSAGARRSSRPRARASTRPAAPPPTRASRTRCPRSGRRPLPPPRRPRPPTGRRTPAGSAAPCVLSTGFEQKEHRFLSSLSMVLAHDF